MERWAATDCAAMELIETALSLPDDQRAWFIAGSAAPIRVRRLALRLLLFAGGQEDWTHRADRSQLMVSQPRNPSRA